MKSGVCENLEDLDAENTERRSKEKQRKTFQCLSRRTVALRISYDGRRYSGMAPQSGKETVGGHLENALKFTGLGEKLVYAGRTDAGVSAISMVVSGVFISRIEMPNRSYVVTESDYKEYKYDMILNSHLPSDIRVIGWAPVPDTFSARFTCIQRQYRYYFHKEDLDADRMREMASRIKKMENFYYFSKHSDKNARYERKLDECRIVDEGDVYYLDIRARAFLHNMVRKIVWAIQKAGKGETYDAERVGTSEPDPLVFCGAIYPHELCFINNPRCHEEFRRQMENDQISYKISQARLESLRNELCKETKRKEEEASHK
ncbi:tRNA pseudouridine synthase A [Encephalitozoon intestinalis ATCC 50506]|uniref:tRNA pseudouridine synthase n=1 Tax=Encephalitozoon intestinalis (strain ATCC 50506) TaxID=876142 RepID=E0SA27_ENCIT|nr:tRNA pseudouridine synthase A [Encephalitozoon intestinalis ATCC 50506]ADM12649.1 tRNA pseudouridine synthase A [Encephalitozoon intestinalis ATCC 50506]UTX46509.1 tRNA pseudouridine synthase A [Encephalitozoon intestinalis]